MENMDIDQLVDIPDTPDRVTSQHIIDSQFRKERNSSVACHSTTSNCGSRECLNEPKPRSRLVGENGFSRRLHLSPRGVSMKTDEFEPRDNSTYSSLQNSNSSQSFPLFRRAPMVNNSKLESGPSTWIQVDKGKAKCNKVLSKSPVSIDEDAIFNMAFPRGGSKTPHAKESKDVQVSSISGSSLHSSPVISKNVAEGKGKLDFGSRNGFCLTMNDGRGSGSSCDLQHKFGKLNYPSYSSAPSPRVTGQKRLVRNGCISPHNIISRAQKLAEIHHVDSSNAQKVHSSNMGTNALSDVPIKEIVAEDNNDEIDFYRAKGKGAMVYPSTSKEHDCELTHVSPGTGTNNTPFEETNGGGVGLLSDGWRSTRNHSKTTYHAEADDDVEVFFDTQHKSRVAGRNNGNKSVTKSAFGSGDQRAAQTTSRPVTGLNQISQPQPVGNIHTKRQKKHGSTSRNRNRGSKAFPGDTEIMFLGSSEESSTARSSATLNVQRQGILEPIYEIDEPTPERRTENSHGSGPLNDEDEDEDARARQVEADEILALELQEQMYHESPVFGGSEVDENMAWLLQEEDDDVLPTAFVRDDSLSRGRNSTIRANRQPQVSQNRSIRRGSQVRVPSTRTSQLRNRLFNHSPTRMSRSRNRYRTAISSLRNFQFPSGMDLDMRLDILGALEDAVGEFNDLSVTATNIHHFQRDFNENDYEMLLALDENIHQHGVSANQINSLPESVVQTENYEDCAICLETPAIGETMRHLPCLHKFHKECIDPWLSRKTSCPVCKSSIT